jgi:hypothetical protein
VHEADGEVAGGGDEGGEVEWAEPCFRGIGGWVDEEALMGSEGAVNGWGGAVEGWGEFIDVADAD